MARVGLVLHNDRSQAFDLAKKAIAWLAEHSHEVVLPAGDALAAGLDDHGVDDANFGAGLDLAVSLGGDGTMLRTVDLVAGTAPVLGVNLGQLGYLTELEPAALVDGLRRFFAGEYEVRERMMLAVRAEIASGLPEEISVVALNEAVLEKTPIGHTVRLAVSLDGEFWTTYAADGLIVATPTGSTAYSFSARGPILAPEHRALVLTPVSPHMLFDRSLVLQPDTEVRLEVWGHRPAALSVDGRTLATLHEGDAIVCTAADQAARLVTFGERKFHRILKAKFGLNDR